MPKLPLLGNFGASAKGRAGKKTAAASPMKLTVAYIIKTAACILAFLGVMAAFSYLCRELENNTLLLILPSAKLTVSWLIRLGIYVICLAVTINLTSVLVRPVWLVVITYLLAATVYILITGPNTVMLVITAIFFASLLTRLLFIVRQLNNQINFSVHPLTDKNMLFFSLLALLVAAAFWFGYTKDMAYRNYVIMPEIKSTIVNLGVDQARGALSKQRLTPAQVKAALAGTRTQIQTMIDGVEKPLKPYAQYVPAVLAAMLLSFLTSVFSLVGFLALPILKLLFILMRLARFTNLKIETREVKHLTLETVDN